MGAASGKTYWEQNTETHFGTSADKPNIFSLVSVSQRAEETTLHCHIVIKHCVPLCLREG